MIPSSVVPESQSDPISVHRRLTAIESQLVEAMAFDCLTIPPYPPVANSLARLINAGDYGLRELADLVRVDQTLAAATIRHANSAMLGQGNQISSLEMAVTRIGTRELVNVVSVLGLAQAVNKRGPLLSLRHGVWRVAVATAEIARRLAVARGLDPEEAFLAGLLHNFGKMIVIATIEELRPGPGELPLATEMSWLTMIDRHCARFGQYVAKQWRLPAVLQEVLASQNPGHEAEIFEDLVDTVKAASEVARGMEKTSVISADFIAGEAKSLPVDASDNVADFLPGLPPFVQTLGLDLPLSMVPSAVESTPLGLANAVPIIKLEATAGNPESPRLYQTSHVSANGVRLTGRGYQQPGALIHVELERDSESLPFWAVVRSSLRDGKQFHLEVQPYALTDYAESQLKAVGS
jgi:HD-like signal output (HDOD) protein